MEEGIVLLLVISAAGICSSYVLKGYRHPYVTIAVHEYCEERWYATQTWITVDNPTEDDGKVIGAYLQGFNSKFTPVKINLKARVSGIIKENGNWTLQTIAFAIRDVIAQNPPQPYSQRIRIVKEPPTIYCAQIPEEGEDVLYFKVAAVAADDNKSLADDAHIVYIVMDDPMQFLVKLSENVDTLKSVYHLTRKRSIAKSEFVIPKIVF